MGNRTRTLHATSTASIQGSTRLQRPVVRYINHSKPLPCWLLDGAFLLTRRSPCVVYYSAQFGQSRCIRLPPNDTVACTWWLAIRRIIPLLRFMAVRFHNERAAIRLHTELRRDRGPPKSHNSRGRKPQHDGAAQAWVAMVHGDI